MSCKHCKTAYDHSIHKPYSSCLHNFCYNCIKTFLNCPDCNETIDKKHPNLTLLEFIPKSESEKLKEELLEDLIFYCKKFQDLISEKIYQVT